MIQKANHREMEEGMGPRPHDAEPPAAIILFDGVCNLCNGWVDFVIERDPQKRFRFAALQSPAGRRLLLEVGLPADFLDSIVLIENGTHYLYSTSILRTLRRLHKLWPVCYALSVVPKMVRDWVYRRVAASRYLRFGKLDACRLPTPELDARFLK